MKEINKRLSAYAGKTFYLKRTSAVKRNLELISEEEVIGSIEFPRLFSFTALVKLFGDAWEIKNESIWKKRLGIYKYGYELPFAFYSGKAIPPKGSVRLDKGVHLDISYNIFKGTSALSTETGETLISSVVKKGFKMTVIININKESQLLDNNPWLVLLLGYIEITRHR